MPNSRTALLAIAVLLLSGVSASAGSTTIPCHLAAPEVFIRDGAVADLVSEVDLACDAAKVTAPPGGFVTVQFSLSVNTTITNATATNTVDNLGPLTMAGLAVVKSMTPQTTQRTYQGRVGDSFGKVNNTVRFPHVNLPTGIAFIVRLFNVRVAAPAQGTEVLATVTANVENPTGYVLQIAGQPSAGTPVGTVVSALKFAVTDCKGNPGMKGAQIQPCIGVPASSNPIFGVTFTELTPTAFKNIVEEDGATLQGTLTPPPNPQICDTAHNGAGDVAAIPDGPPTIPACASAAWVSNGTRLMAKFRIPQALVGKIHIVVSRFQTATPNGSKAQLVSTGDMGWGKLPAGLKSPAVPCTGVGGAATNSWVTLPDGTLETAAWEITSDDVAANESITFAWAITASGAALPQTIPAIEISGTIAPISTQAVPAPVALANEPVVRFHAALINGSPNQKITPHVCGN